MRLSLFPACCSMIIQQGLSGGDISQLQSWRWGQMVGGGDLMCELASRTFTNRIHK